MRKPEASGRSSPLGDGKGGRGRGGQQSSSCRAGMGSPLKKAQGPLSLAPKTGLGEAEAGQSLPQSGPNLEGQGADWCAPAPALPAGGKRGV